VKRLEPTHKHEIHQPVGISLDGLVVHRNGARQLKLG
jgi:hypothetical protein